MTNLTTIRVAVSPTQLAHGHYESLQAQTIESMRAVGIPVIGDWMIRGVENGTLTATWRPATGLTYEWVGVLALVDDLDELI